MRIKNSINNIKYSMIFYFINTILGFISRTALISYIGGDFVGLSSVFMNILGYLNVVELGIGQSVTYSLYKPLKEKDYKKINTLLLLYKKIYSAIGIFIALGTVVISVFIGKIVHTEAISIDMVRIYFYIYAIMTISSYFLTYIQILVIAEQKQYIITKVTGYFYTIKIIVQIITSVIFKNYNIWIGIELFYNIFTYLYINKKVFKEHQWIDLNLDIKFIDLFNENKKVFIDTKNLLYHKIAGVVVFQTDSIVISTFSNLKSVAIYGNYIMVENIVKSIIGMIFGGVRASVGDLIAEGNDQKSYFMWRDMYFFSNLIGTILVYCFFVNINDFMNLWLGEGYLMNNLAVFMLAINLFIYITRTPTVTFNFGYGLFWDKWAAATEAIVNLVISLVLVKYLGIAGVLIGTFMSNILIVVLWKPYMLFRYGFKRNINEYIKDTFKILFFILVSISISNSILNYINIEVNNLLISLILRCTLSFISIAFNYIIISCIDKTYRVFYKKYIYLLNRIVKQVV